jgi:hypothetical protein
MDITLTNMTSDSGNATVFSLTADASISGEYELKVPQSVRSTAMDNDRSYCYRMVWACASAETETIETVDIGNIWTRLDPINVIPFTAEVHDENDADGINFNEKMEITNEAWIGGSVIDKQGGSGIPKIGTAYEHLISLRAKSGWAFGDSFELVYGGRTMTSGYDVDISSDHRTAVITGLETAEVKPVDITEAKVSGITNKTYSGAAIIQEPEITMDVNGTAVKLKAGRDYVLSYGDNVNVGKATVTATGKGNYTGSLTRTFSISKAKNPLRISPKKVKVGSGKHTLAVDRLISFKKQAKDQKSYKISSVRKGGRKYNKYFKINGKRGTLTMK